MKKISAAFFELEQWEQEYLKTRLPRAIVPFFFNRALSQSALKKIRACEILSVFIYSEITEKIITNLPSLKLIHTCSTGFNHIDIHAARKRGIAVTHVPYYGENTVAEHSFALLLSLARKTHLSYAKTIRADFSIKSLRGFDLAQKTLGIIGMGHIGLHSARIARGVSMKVQAYDPYPNQLIAKKYAFCYVTLEKLLKTSDVIFLHCPLNEKTHHLINKQNIKLLKKGAVLINTSRGQVVDTEALIYALDHGILKAAGLDVLESECVIVDEKQILHHKIPQGCDLKTVVENHLLLQYDNVLITPHNAFNTEEALTRILDTTITTIASFIRGRMINRVAIVP